VANALSLDCDCDANQGDPVMSDIGIFASLDPVANDQAFIDAIWAAEDAGAKDLRGRIDSLEGRAILPYAEKLGLGTTKYDLVEL
ncbi:ferredoxin, partial [Candidatus Saccharibacteria bacterium]|nr:ferredoxin [Candidatus Saccharibacteria bacterium]